MLTNGMGILDDLIDQCVLYEVKVLRKSEPIDNTGSWLLELVYKACTWLKTILLLIAIIDLRLIHFMLMRVTYYLGVEGLGRKLLGRLGPCWS